MYICKMSCMYMHMYISADGDRVNSGTSNSAAIFIPCDIHYLVWARRDPELLDQLQRTTPAYLRCESNKEWNQSTGGPV